MQHQAGTSFPPYRLLERDYLEMATEKLARVERLYHVGHRHAWDGQKVLQELIAAHGKGGRVDLPVALREDIAAVLTPILWGELAAWNVAADLALRLRDVSAKMAATSQVFDEARHFYVMRDYLLRLDVELPPLDGFAQTVLIDLLQTESLVEKLLGMQLIVENVAVALFRSLTQVQVEPVLTHLLPYLERDEARHVGLGVLYLPELLEETSALEVARLAWRQLKIATLLGWTTQYNRHMLAHLSIDPNVILRLGIRLQAEVVRRMVAESGRRRGSPVRGVLFGTRAMDRFNDLAIELFFPPLPSAPPSWQRAIIRACDSIAATIEPLLRTGGRS
jgi:hypothetical protein